MAATKSVSIVTGGTNSATTTASEINALATDFISNGVVGAISLNTGSGGTGSFAPNAQGTPAMSVRISAGQGYVSATPTGGTSQRVRLAADTFEDVTIPANATGGTRYDWVYAQIDATKLANPGVNKDDVFTYVVSRSTSSATDNGTPPTYGYNLAVVTVANGAASITNANITDQRVRAGAQTTTAQIPNANVTADKLATGAATAVVATNESTASATYVQLTTTTDQVTVTIGANGLALISISAYLANNGTAENFASVDISGATTVAASDTDALDLNSGNTTNMRASSTFLKTGLTPGSTTFKMMYRTTANNLSAKNRRISVVPL